MPPPAKKKKAPYVLDLHKREPRERSEQPEPRERSEQPRVETAPKKKRRSLGLKDSPEAEAQDDYWYESLCVVKPKKLILNEEDMDPTKVKAYLKSKYAGLP